MVRTTQFSDLESQLDIFDKFPRFSLDKFVKDETRPTAIIITRDGCSDSAKFEQYIPDLENLFSGKAILERVHVKYSENNKEESDRAKRILKISGYHTVIIYVPSPYGNLESYRETEPEIERVTEQINKALDRTEIYQKLKIRTS